MPGSIRNFFYFLLSTFVFFPLSCSKKTTGSRTKQNSSSLIFLIGTPHRDTKGTKKHDLYNAIERIQPDILLIEADSSLMEKDFSFSPAMQNVFDFGLGSSYIKAY